MAVGAALATAAAATTVFTFEGLQNAEEVLNYYNGGLGSLGSGPGPADGVTFTSNGTAFISADTDFAGNPSGVTAFTFVANGNPAIMDVAAGFTTNFSFYYSAIFGTGTINIYSGLDGTGTLLASFTPPVTPSEQGSNPACAAPSDTFCPFFYYVVSFSGTAQSVDFTATENLVAFDDITIGPVPEPGAFSLLGLGLASLMVIRRKHSGALRRNASKSGDHRSSDSRPSP